MANYILHFDGSCGPKNPGGTAAYGFALMLQGQEAPVEHGSGVIGSGPGMTNNLAEFYALAEGLRSFQRNTAANVRHTLQVYGDSNLVIQVMNRHWRARPDKPYYAAYADALGLLEVIRQAGQVVSLDWVPRELNTVCDDLSKGHRSLTT